MPKYTKSGLTPAKKKFAHEYAKTDNATKAALAAYPDISSREVAAVKGHRLLRNDNVSSEIAMQKQRIQALANKAVRVFDENMDSEIPNVSQRAAEFVWEQSHGKATQRIETESRLVSIDINLTGTDKPTPG